MALKKVCRCGKLIDYSEKMCSECMTKTKQREKDRQKNYDVGTRKSIFNRKYDNFYHSREWSIARKVAITRDKALCQDCLAKNKIMPYDTVHHIQPIKENWGKRLDINNLVCLCESCHQERHKRLNKRF